MKVEDEDEELLQEELLDVVSAEQFEVQMSGGACAQVNESRITKSERPELKASKKLIESY